MILAPNTTGVETGTAGAPVGTLFLLILTPLVGIESCLGKAARQVLPRISSGLGPLLSPSRCSPCHDPAAVAVSPASSCPAAAGNPTLTWPSSSPKLLPLPLLLFSG